MEVFAIFPDGAPRDCHWDGTSWHAWESLGGSLKSSAVPVTASWGPGRLSVIACGIDGATWQRWWHGSRWVEWELLAP